MALDNVPGNTCSPCPAACASAGSFSSFGMLTSSAHGDTLRIDHRSGAPAISASRNSAGHNNKNRSCAVRKGSRRRLRWVVTRVAKADRALLVALNNSTALAGNLAIASSRLVKRWRRSSSSSAVAWAASVWFDRGAGQATGKGSAAIAGRISSTASDAARSDAARMGTYIKPLV